jgi:leader peptidase (prepilin peptidase)/N-methyltransferase
MSVYTAVGFGLAGALTGIPIAAFVYETAPVGPTSLAARWWIGGHAPLLLVAATSLVSGGGAMIVSAVVPMGFALPAYWVFAVLGAGLALIDLRSRRLPFLLTGATGASSIVCFALDAMATGNAEPLVRAAVAGVSVTALLLIVALATPGQLGLGDVAFTGVIALILAWRSIEAAAMGLLTGLLLQAAVVMVSKGRVANNASSPMGPALFAGFLIAVAVCA